MSGEQRRQAGSDAGLRYSAAIRDAIKDMDLTQRRFAKLVHCSESHLSEILAGRRLPVLELAKAIAAELPKVAADLDQLYGLARKELAPRAGDPLPVPARPTRVVHLPQRQTFVGREDVLAALQSAFHGERSTRPGVCRILAGPGGFGKTAIALEYAYRNVDRYEAVVFLRGGGPAQHAACVSGGLVQRLGLSEPAAPELVRQRLGEFRSLLLVIDDADPADLAAFIDRCDVLVTCRSWPRPDAPEVIDIGALSRADSVALVRTWYRDAAEADADWVADHLADTPLAIICTVAGANSANRSLASLRELLSKDPRPVTGSAADLTGDRADDGTWPAGARWMREISELDSVAPAAGAMLRLCAVLAPEWPIPLDLFTAYPAPLPALLRDVATDPGRWDVEVVAPALAARWFSPPEPDHVTVHRLVARALRVHTPRQVRLETCRTMLRIIADAALGDRAELVRSTVGWRWWATVLPHVLALLNDPETAEAIYRHEPAEQRTDLIRAAVELAGQAGTFLQLAGATDEALPLFRRAVAITTGLDMEEPAHASLAAGLFRGFAGALLASGAATAATEAAEKALALDTKHRSDEQRSDAVLATDSRILATALLRSGRLTEATGQALLALQILTGQGLSAAVPTDRERTRLIERLGLNLADITGPGIRADDVSTSLAAIAAVAQAEGDLTSAVGLLKLATAVDEREQQTSQQIQPVSLARLFHLAGLVTSQGDQARGQELTDQATVLATQCYGTAAPEWVQQHLRSAGHDLQTPDQPSPLHIVDAETQARRSEAQVASRAADPYPSTPNFLAVLRGDAVAVDDALEEAGLHWPAEVRQQDGLSGPGDQHRAPALSTAADAERTILAVARLVAHDLAGSSPADPPGRVSEERVERYAWEIGAWALRNPAPYWPETGFDIARLVRRLGLGDQPASPAAGRAHTDRLMSWLHRAVGGLLISRLGNPNCPDLEQIRSGWNHQFDPLLRDRVLAHVDECSRCRSRRAALIGPEGHGSRVRQAALALPLAETPLFRRAEGDQRGSDAGTPARDSGVPEPRSRRPWDAALRPGWLVGALAAVVLGVIAAFLIGRPASPADPGKPGASPTSAPTAAGPAMFRLSDRAVDFGQAEATYTVTIRNDGGTPAAVRISTTPAWLTVGSVNRLVSGGSARLIIRLDRRHTPRGPFTIRVRFSPREGGSGDQLVVYGNGAVSPATFRLSQRTVDLGTGSTIRTVTLFNDGGRPDGILLGPRPGWLHIDGPARVAPGRSGPLLVYIDRATAPAGPFAVRVALLPAAGGNGDELLVTGDTSRTEPVPPARFRLTPATVDLGVTARSQNVVLRNDGGLPAVIIVDRAGIPSWIHTSVSGRPVAPGGIAAVAVTVDRDLAPLGAFSAHIRIRPSSGGDTATLKVRGTVAGPTALGKVSTSRRTAPVAVTADSSPSTAGSTPLARYDFDWGDGTHTSAQSSLRANHTYPRAGTYTIRLMVTDRASRVASHQWTVIVRSPLPGPTLVEPAADQHYDGAEQVITFTWSAVPSAVGYQLDLERLDGGNWVSDAMVRVGGTSTTQRVVKFSYNSLDHFRWRIRAVDSDSVLGAPSVWRAFEIYEPG